MQIIDGRKMAEKIKDGIVKEIIELNKNDKLKNKRPNLAIILIGEREDSKLYVNLKEKEAKIVGIDTHTYKCPENIKSQEVIDIINCLNKDGLIDAILVQLPLPEDLDTNAIISAIDPKKDVDRFHPENLGKLLKTCDHNDIIPPVFEVVLKILKNIKFNLNGKTVCLLANSDIFGQSLAKVLECRKAKVKTFYPDNKEFINSSSQADLLVTAIGRPGFIKKEMVKEGAVIIDIGIKRLDNRILGDVDFKDVKGKVGYITPVPGGVGPLTIAMLFKNTLELYKNRGK